MGEQGHTNDQAQAPTRRPNPHRGGRPTRAPVGPLANHPAPAVPAGAPTEAQIGEAWLRAEACCECGKEAYGHAGRCDQFLIWAERGGTGKGAWEARALQDPR